MILRPLNRPSHKGGFIAGTPYVGILAADIAAHTAVGDSGPGILYDESIAPANAGKLLRAEIDSDWPGVGTITVSEEGIVDAAGLADGAYTFAYRVYADDVFVSTDAFTIITGLAAGSAAAGGANLTGLGTLDSGAASAVSAGSGDAPGASLTGTGSIAAGSVSAGATAAGSALTGGATLDSGAAAGDALTVIEKVMARAAQVIEGVGSVGFQRGRQDAVSVDESPYALLRRDGVAMGQEGLDTLRIDIAFVVDLFVSSPDPERLEADADRLYAQISAALLADPVLARFGHCSLALDGPRSDAESVSETLYRFGAAYQIAVWCAQDDLTTPL